MPDAFFSKPNASKRKRPSTGGPPGAKGGSTSSGARPGAKGRPSAGAAAASTSTSKSKKKRDEELSDGGSDVGVEDMDLRRDTRGGESDEEERVRAGRETGGEKRLRMAREYLEGLEKEQDDGTYDAAEIDRDIMASRLQSDVLSHSPKIHVFLGDYLSEQSTKTYFLPLPNLPPTAARASPATPYLYTSSKSGALSKYSLQTGQLLAHWPRLARPTKEEKKEMKGKGKAAGATGGWSVEGRDLKGHTGEVLDLAVSEDGKWVATAGREGVVGCWDVEGETGKWVRGLRGHRDAVTSLAFQSQSLTLYTTSLDRTISVFSLSTLSHLETLFGHQDSTHSLSTLRAENLVSAGSRDRTVRFWKIPEESQLVFRGGGGSKGVWAEDDDIEEEKEREARLAGKEGEGPSKIERRRKRLGKQKDAYKEGSIDCVAMVDEQHFLSGGDSGAIALWTITKKKPVFINHLSHGLNEHESESEGVIGTARWITSLACLPYGDTFVSGSWDGSIRVWQLAPNLKSFAPIFTIPALGFVNSLQLLTPSVSLVDFSRWKAAANIPKRTTSFPDPSAPAVPTGPVAKKDAKTTLLMVASVGQEPRMGRWMKFGTKETGARNGVVVAHLEAGAKRIVEEDVSMDD